MRNASLLSGLILVAVAGLSGCRSRYVEATVKNATGGPVTVVEVDYPSASFGKETLAAGDEYHYRFKIQGDGPLKALWTDAGRHEHSVDGPVIREGDEGTLVVTLRGDGVGWDVSVKK